MSTATASPRDALILGADAVAEALGSDGGRIALARPGWSFLLAAIAGWAPGSLLAIVPQDEEARDLSRALQVLLGRSAVALWPALGVAPDSDVPVSPHLVGQRARARAVLGCEGRVVVAGVATLAEPVPAASSLPAPVRAAVGESHAPEDLTDALVAAGYARVGQVEERGELALRGGILDVYPTTADLPVRVDFFGDEIESLRAFSPFSQRTVRPLERFVAWPAAEGGGRPSPALDPGALAGVTTVVLGAAEYETSLRIAAERLGAEHAGDLAPAAELTALLEEAATLAVSSPSDPRAAAFDAVEARFATRGDDEAQAELARLARAGMRVVVGFPRRGDMERAAARLERLAPEVLEPGALPARGSVGFTAQDLRAGMISRALGLAIVPAGALLRRRAPARPAVGRRVSSLLELRVGDHVVHEDHGVGRLIAFETRDVAGVTRDYLHLAFAGEDRLWVPHEQVDKITRYVGADGSDPELNKLGGKAWDRMKSRARKAVREMAGELIALYEARERAKGHAFVRDDELMAELEARFAHSETRDQLRAIDAVAEDMERPRPMDRLICGDVGFGKTEIAMRAAFTAAAGGRQVMVMVPTTILAQQHLASFRERFDGLPVTVDAVNRFRSKGEVAAVLDRFASGELDVIVGTHRLLSMDVRPKKLGLVIVDEEQRFGVAQKEALRKLRLSVDVLAMSATPIPRTLQISLSGMRDITVIETAPSGRKPVVTHVGEFDEALVTDAIERELSRKGQVFWVHNRVETIDAAAEAVRALASDARVAVAHGQMAERELEDVMLGFVRGEADVLVATSIIESGIDIPNANTLVVERSDQLGLSQLYQLRGRVGRSERTAYAYLMYPEAAALTREASARLAAIGDYTELGSGLKIAMRDLEIRGAGNLLGDEQSGHVAAIGFELYLEMLEEAVALSRGAPPPEREVRVDIPVSAFIPADYIDFEAAKIEMHRRIAAAGPEELAELADELADRFGEVPAPVEALLGLGRVRALARAVGADHVGVAGGRVVVAPVSMTSAGLRALRASEPSARWSAGDRRASVEAEAAPAARLAAAERLLAVLGECAEPPAAAG